MKTINKLLAPIKKKTMNALVANYKWLEKQVRANNVTYNNISNNYETNIDTKSEIAAISSYKREVAINEILKSKEYDFDNMLVHQKSAPYCTVICTCTICDGYVL